MSLRAVILVLAFGLVFVCTGFGDIIPVNNPSFETLPVGGLPYADGVSLASVGPIPGWSETDPSQAGQFQPGGPSGSPNPFINIDPDGTPTEAYADAGTIFQTVGTTVQVGVTYTLQVDIGARNDNPFAGSADLLINGIQYAATGVENSGGFATYTATYTGLPSDNGDAITIQLNSAGVQANFDDVRLVAAPEPSAVILLATALLAVAFSARKHLVRGL